MDAVEVPMQCLSVTKSFPQIHVREVRVNFWYSPFYLKVRVQP